LHPNPQRAALDSLEARAVYNGIPKHKEEPLKFGLPLYTGRRGDETLCDRDAGFTPDERNTVPPLLIRGIRAGLVGHIERQGVPTILWSVSDQGWIFEARITNVGLADYHGYPVRPSESIAEQVYRRFLDWARVQGTDLDRKAAANCRALYGFGDDQLSD
jgi:hypothetical protein